MQEKQECCAVAIGSASLAGAYGAGKSDFSPPLEINWQNMLDLLD